MNDADSADADAEFNLTRRKVLERDKNTCKLCGFKSSKWQEVHHINDDHSDNRLENLATCCSFCHMCQHIGRAGLMEEAALVWLPEIPQDTLHHLVRTILVAKRWAETSTQQRQVRPDMIKNAQTISAGADRLMAAFQAREDEAEERLGTSDLRELGNIMMAMPDDQYEQRGEFLHGFRMLPLGVREQDGHDIMSKVVDSWSDPGGAYVNLRPQAWLGLFKGSLQKMGG